MKALYSFVLLGGIVLTTNSAQAQSRARHKYSSRSASTTSFGVKAGVSQAVLDGTVNQITEYKAGLHLGAFMRYRPSNHFALQPEITYSQQGSNNTVPLGSMDIVNKTKLSYLNVPILAKVYLGDVFNIQFGPQFGLLLSGRQVGQTGYTMSSSSGTTYQTADVETTKDYKSDVALCGGLGVDLKNGLIIATRINYGLTNIDNNTQSQEARTSLGFGGLHNRVVEFSLGYAF
ncbi:porin family protein [Hymenobacter crusticola]|uniref:Outer membrane protein beta-barrel domain-containing protein n=1 Tax=Hymenobacter crusticola TaxID=1770526 RepID=A0A243WCJ8_9BACT|nr:porin family protein [Hymenobacter crusticola]OUJ73360.1 hypothetical protein BXP70_13165 [Hymenobacter crusticola]